MILVDKNIKELSAEGKLIKEAYTEENVNSISYDLTLGSFADKAETEKKLIPGATVIIKTKEKLSIPDNITGRVGEKNSLLNGIKSGWSTVPAGSYNLCLSSRPEYLCG